jgi:hypothetical protein
LKAVFILRTIIQPRQARVKHKETLKQEMRFPQVAKPTTLDAPVWIKQLGWPGIKLDDVSHSTLRLLAALVQNAGQYDIICATV